MLREGLENSPSQLNIPPRSLLILGMEKKGQISTYLLKQLFFVSECDISTYISFQHIPIVLCKLHCSTCSESTH